MFVCTLRHSHIYFHIKTLPPFPHPPLLPSFFGCWCFKSKCPSLPLSLSGFSFECRFHLPLTYPFTLLPFFPSFSGSIISIKNCPHKCCPTQPHPPLPPFIPPARRRKESRFVALKPKNRFFSGSPKLVPLLLLSSHQSMLFLHADRIFCQIGLPLICDSAVRYYVPCGKSGHLIAVCCCCSVFSLAYLRRGGQTPPGLRL